MKTYTLTVRLEHGDYNYTVTTSLDVTNNITNVLTAYIAMAGSRKRKIVEKAIEDGYYSIQAA
jgi:hypothetical protein